MENVKREYEVFRDKDGNRFVFPGIYDSLEEGRSIDFYQCLGLSMLLHVDRENFRLAAELDETGEFTIPRLISSAGHPNFAHGSETVWIIGGPMFDEVWAEAA